MRFGVCAVMVAVVVVVEETVRWLRDVVLVSEAELPGAVGAKEEDLHIFQTVVQSILRSACFVACNYIKWTVDFAG